jgi:SAM-dependent methyltransferase
MSDVEKSVLDVYKRVNPSIYHIESDEKEFKARNEFMKNLFLKRLCFPPKMFSKSTLLEFGSGTGENSLFYLKWGATCTFVEMNDDACTRAKTIFSAFGISPTAYSIQNKSLFDFNSDVNFDIVTSNGVIHHTDKKEKAFDIHAKHVRPGGFLVMGIGTAAGAFQRNLQKAIIYQFAKDENEIISLAERLFSDHLDRAERFGGRNRTAIIYDSYVNPKMDVPTISEIMRWFSMNGLELYSSWPPMTPALLGDSVSMQPAEYGSILGLPQMIWASHNEDDITHLKKINRGMYEFVGCVEELTTSMNDIVPDKETDLRGINENINRALAQKPPNPYPMYISKFHRCILEAREIVEHLRNDDLEGTEKCIRKSKEIFHGTAGLGMNWFVGYKE